MNRFGIVQRTSANQPQFWVGVIVAVLILIFLIHYFTSQSQKTKRNPPVPVVVTSASRSNVPVYIPALGSVTPTYNVTILSQIDGYLLRVPFQEGQMVKKGDLLAEIDPRPYQAQLLQFTGQLVRDQALLANAKLDLKRYKMLLPSGAVSKQVYDTQVALVKQDEGNVQFDIGQIAVTKVNLNYCFIRSPIDGRVGLRLVDPGNYVQTSNTTGIAVVNTINPITVVFPIPEDNIPELLQNVLAGKKLRVEAYDRWQNKLLDVGTLITIDNVINSSTGTVNLKAQFPNQHYTLFPEQFVNIKLLAKTLMNATVIPTVAIQHAEQGSFVFLVNPDGKTVSVKPITVNVTVGGQSAVSGIAPGQQVVIEGTDKLTKGAEITIARPAMPSQPTKQGQAA